ncbi:SWIM zinc finger family protein [Corynebacterium glutamicum]
MYLVIINEESAACSCPWYTRHSGNSGPCKHVLAAHMNFGSLR